MRKVIACAAIAGLAAGLALAAAQKKSGTAKKTSSTKKGSAAKGKKGGKTRKQSAQTWRNRQLAPARERYAQIQQALVEKGYLQGAASGSWDQASSDALRKFQRDQHLNPSGKIDSLSLIALGLGPQYDNAPVAPPPRPDDSGKK